MDSSVIFQINQAFPIGQLFFLNNFQQIEKFQEGIIQDARLLGDGYDFQIEKTGKFYLTEVKGVRKETGGIRLTQNEYKKAQEYQDDYFVIVVSNLEEIPKIIPIENPIKNIKLEKKEIVNNQIFYHSSNLKW